MIHAAGCVTLYADWSTKSRRQLSPRPMKLIARAEEHKGSFVNDNDARMEVLVHQHIIINKRTQTASANLNDRRMHL